jgi:hypothetical protein
MGNVSMQIPRAVSPLLTGILFAANELVLPFFIGAAFQAAYLVMYYSSFRWVDDATPQQSRDGSPATATASVDPQSAMTPR